ncbi:MAG TPA: glycosyltransferase [Terriglobales bacterium]|nr:glycosyltransferase [Terriglobales bacterium]
MSRLDPDRFVVMMMNSGGPADKRLMARPNTKFVRASTHGTAARLMLQCMGFRPDIYFYPLASPFNEVYLDLHRLLRLKSKIVVHVVGMVSLHAGVRRNWFGGDSVDKAIGQADAVFGNSQAVANDVSRVFRVKAGTIHNGVDRRFFYPRRHGINNSRLRVLYVGSFRPYKRVQDAIKAAARHPEADFCLVGEGEDKQQCIHLAKELGCANVEFLGSISPAEVGDQMRASDLFFLPSVVEGHPQVLAQAAACGLPCIARDSYSPDSVVHNRTGFLAADEMKLGEYLDLLLSDPDLRASFGAAGIEHAKQYDWDRIVQVWTDVFESLVPEHGTGN